MNDTRTETDNGGSGYNAGIAVFSYIVGGIIVWSLVGWGLDNLFGTRWIVLAGAFLGAGGGFYLAYVHNLTRSQDGVENSTPTRRDDAADGDQT